MYFNELLTYEEIQEKYKKTQHDAICYLLKGGLFQDMSEILERIESLEERAEDLKQRMTEVETTVVQIMEKFDDYYTKTEIDAMISAIDPGIVDRINPGTTTQQGFFSIEIEVE